MAFMATLFWAVTPILIAQSISGSDQTGSMEIEQIRKCRQPAEAGPCRAGFLRYFYDHKSNDCKMFTYGGCFPNDNNFRKKEQCQSRCGAMVAQTPCKLAKLPEPPSECRYYHYNNVEIGCPSVAIDCPNRKPTKECSPITPVTTPADCKSSKELRDENGCPFVVIDCSKRLEPGSNYEPSMPY